MNRIILLVFFVFSYCMGNSQAISNRGSSVVTVQDARLFAQYNFRPPAFRDTTEANTNLGLDSCGALIFTRTTNTYWLRSCTTPKKWIAVGSGSGGAFQRNIIMNATQENRLGYWVNGDTIPVAGLSLDSAFKVITQKAVAPTYTEPKAFISSSPTAGNREIGDTFNVSLSSTFIQNNGGLSTDTTYYRGTNALAANSDVVRNLTLPVSYTVQIAYDTGACKNNNQGQQDCTGRVVAGIATSLTPVTFTPLPKRYWGYLVNYGAPTSAQVLDTLGGSSELSTSRAGTFTVTVSGSNRYLYYAYPKSYSLLTSLKINGFENLGVFTPQFEITLINAKGYSQLYYVYVSKTAQNAGEVTFITQ
jgi:hypothetical protein